MDSEVSQHVHVDRPEHGASLNYVKILTVENWKFERGVKEAMYIRVVKLSLNNIPGLELAQQHHHGANSTYEKQQRWLKDLSSKANKILCY